MRKVQLGKTGEQITVLGQGTWGIKKRHKEEYYEQWKQSLRRGIELGITHIDTSEFYGGGISEKIVGEVIAEHNRDDLFITSKLFPKHFGEESMKKACDKSLKRLGIKNLDLYLIHWPSFVFGAKVKKHMKVMEELLNEGKIRYIGVSNYSLDQFKEGNEFLKKAELVTNQLVANVSKQKHIHKSLPYYKKEGVTLTAYSPLGHRGFTKLEGEIKNNLDKVAKAHNASIQQIAIAWLISHENIITIPKAFQIKHLEANTAAADIKLSKEEIESFYGVE
jgi:diketogulonate reductase-like aldo/keto reductase